MAAAIRLQICAIQIPAIGNEGQQHRLDDRVARQRRERSFPRRTISFNIICNHAAF
jgi:hypothetical protein